MVVEGKALAQIGIGRKESPVLIPARGSCDAPVDVHEFEFRESCLGWWEDFTSFAKMCKAVIACRVSPNQKAEVRETDVLCL